MAARRPLSAEEGARWTRFRDELGLPERDAGLLAGDPALAALFDDAFAVHPQASAVANWIVNEVVRVGKERPLADLPFGGAEVGELAAMVDAGTLSATLAKEVFAAMVEGGGRPGAIVAARGLGQVRDEGSLAPRVDAVLAAHPGEAAQYRSGKASLLGFFVGQVMRATGGTADPAMVHRLLRERLEGPPADGDRIEPPR